MKNTVSFVSASPANTIEEVYFGFTGGAPEMEGKTLVKLCKDCGLLDKSLTTTDVDLIFARVKSKTARKVTFE